MQRTERTVLSIALALGLALTVAGAAGGRSEAATRIQLSTTLNAAQEVPVPSGDVSGARGTFTATVTRTASGAALAWRLTFTGLTGPATAAHVHVAPRGQAGPVAVPLCGPCASGATGSTAIEGSVVNAIHAGRAYVNVHTAQNAAGEIRGQLAIVANVRVVLNAAQERPRPTGNVTRSRGVFTARVTRSGPTAVVAWRLTFSRLTGRATAAHIHLGVRGTSGPVRVALCGPCRSGVRGRAALGAPLRTALEAGRLYVNVHTARNPAGEIRGQLPAVPLTLSGGGGGGGGEDPYP